MSPFDSMTKDDDGTAVEILKFDMRFQSLLANPTIAAAVEASDAEKLYRLLQSERRRIDDADLRESLDRLISQRRRFVFGTRKTPTFSIGIFGRLPIGPNYERRDDGSRITTVWRTFAYIPIWPCDAWLTSRDEKARRAAAIPALAFLAGILYHGRVPLLPYQRAWRNVFYGFFATVAAVLVVGGIISSRESTIRIVNGLDIPMTVECAGAKLDIAPKAHVEKNLTSGHYELTTRRAGNEIERVEIDVPSNHRLVIYNILGASPLAIDRIEYVSDERFRNETNLPRRFIGGRPVYVGDRVDYEFTEPPDQIDLGSRETTRIVTILNPIDERWETTIAEMMKRDAKAAADLARRIVLIDPSRDEGIDTAIEATRSTDGRDAAIRFAEEVSKILRERSGGTITNDVRLQIGRLESTITELSRPK